MANKLAMRKDMATYMNTAATGADPKVWSLMGTGFTELELSMNPTEYSRQYVNESTERTDVIGYATAYSYNADIYTEEPPIVKIDDITSREKLGTDAKVEAVTVLLYRPVEDKAGEYEAFLRDFNVIPDAKGPGVEALTLSGELRAAGDQTEGTFNVATSTFTPLGDEETGG